MDDVSLYVRRLVAARVSSGYSQAEVAELTSIPQSTLSKIESGAIANPSFVHLVKIASALDINLDRLVSDSEAEFLREIEWLNLVYRKATSQSIDITHLNWAARAELSEAVARRAARAPRLNLTREDMIDAVREAAKALKDKRPTSSSYDLWREAQRGKWKGSHSPPSSSVLRKWIGPWPEILIKAFGAES